MALAGIALITLTFLLIGYRLYGGWIAREYRLDDRTKTPAETLQDGVDFVPTKPFYLLGQHFSAIAAAGPIVGPILACQQFGWLPCLLWVTIGCVFIGAVHDFSALVTSIRHKARSIVEVVRENIGKRAWIAMMGFVWLMLTYVITAFADITAATFVGRIEELEGIPVSFERGGAVAAASTLYLLLAVTMGLIQKWLRPPLWLITLIFVPATLGVVWLGTIIPTHFLFSHRNWAIIILAYCFVASLLPVWLLLQPRGYLGGFILYMVLALGLVGIFFGGYEIQQDAFKTWNAPGVTGSLFPFLFVTIACGACSGFHGLVCSGTTSKQISKESHCRPIGYGGMLLEAFVALISLATIMIVAQEEVNGPPGAIYGAGIGRFLTLLIGKEKLIFAITFGAMAFSTFVFDTLDVATRLARYVLQELMRSRTLASALLATAATVGLPAFFLLTAPQGSWNFFWVLFGTANQLLAALTLTAVTVWLRAIGRRYWFTLIPMIFVMGTTLWSLTKLITTSFSQGQLTMGISGLALFLLAAWVLGESAKAFSKTCRTSVPAA